MTQAVRVVLIGLGAIGALFALLFALLFAGRASEADVSDPVQLAPAVETTAPAVVEHQLVVGSPQVGDVATSPLGIEGTSTARQLGYRLYGAGMPLAEGTIVVDAEGRFSTTVEFTNTCCIEMALEVFDIRPDAGLGITVPLAYPETS
jgi:hypothetical protein